MDARTSDAALDSEFRRRWTPWTRVRVTLLGWLIAVVLRLVYATLRVRWSDPGGMLARRERGERFVFAAWHDGLPLLPLVLRHVPVDFRPRALISWHRDAEIAAQALRRFGVRFMRGSSTRGGIGAVRGLLGAHRAGEDVVVIPDGPRGPRHEAKLGVVQIGQLTRSRIVPIGLAAAPCRRLGSWDRMQVPLPFARVVIRFAPPVDVADGGEPGRARLQAAMDANVAEAARELGGRA
jgi:hypothetical protein